MVENKEIISGTDQETHRSSFHSTVLVSQKTQAGTQTDRQKDNLKHFKSNRLRPSLLDKSCQGLLYLPFPLAFFFFFLLSNVVRPRPAFSAQVRNIVC